MQNGHINNQKECLECDLPTQEYLNYFDGLFMTARDFHTEQSHRIGKHRQHNRYLHGWGTVCGLRIVQHPDPACRDRFVILEPGLALDCCGREIVVREQVYIDLVKYLAPQSGNSTVTGDILLFSLCYAECKTEFVPALYSECGCDEIGCEASRIHEGFEVEVQRVNQLPQPLVTEPVGVRLLWKTTFNLAQATYLALDAVRKRLYVLTAADPGQIMVYDTDNGVLLTTITKVEAPGRGLAIDPTGHFLYIIRHVAGSPGNYFLRVVNIQDLNNPNTVNDLPLTDGTLDNRPQLRVSPADGRVFTLDININPKKLIIWKTSITASTVDPNLPLTDPNSPKYAEVTHASHPDAILNDPRAIAVSPDGIWLFVADGTNVIQVSRIDTLTQPAASQVTQTVSLGETPRLLAVSGDSLRLYVVTAPATGDRKVRAFEIKAGSTSSPPTLTEIGSGVAIGANDPVALTVSPSGKWAYILSKDSTGKGAIQVINGEKLVADPGHAVLTPTAVLASPQDLLLSPDGRQVYASGSGTTDQPASGASVLDVDEEPCREILWRALEGCPTCPEDMCVPLGAIRGYKNGMAIGDRDIDNRIRPLVPSTETLRKLILCALETGTGKQGPEGPPGKDGKDGKDGVPGQDGEGLERDLTRITGLSWNHNEGGNNIATIQYQVPGGEQRSLQGFVVRFSNDVRVLKVNATDFGNSFVLEANIAARHIFQVLIEENPSDQQTLRCRCPADGFVLPVTFPPGSADTNTTSAQVFTNSVNVTEDGKTVTYLEAPGMAWIVPESTTSVESSSPLVSQRTGVEVWVMIQGDFIVDKNGKAIDAEFVRAKLPTGDRPQGSNVGVQGGLFESWFWIGERPKRLQGNVSERLINLLSIRP